MLLSNFLFGIQYRDFPLICLSQFLFDSSQRRVCEVRSRRTNTPLHALTLMNDLSLREAAREIAHEYLHTSKVLSELLDD